MKRAISLLAALAVSLCAYAQHSFVVGRTELKGADTGLFRMDSFYWGEGVVSSSGSTPLLGMEQTLSSGSALADIRAITYEDGAPVIEDGRLYLSGSTRTGGSGIAIVALTLGTGELEFTGTLNCLMAGEFWKICAPHIMYDRTRKLWQVTTPMHAPTDHHLWIATANNDLRFGVSTLEFSPLDYEGPKKGDEDCQIFYDKAMRRWVMIYASTRRPDDGSGYILRLQTSKRPDGGFRDYSYQTDVSATGVTTTLIGGTRYVLSGNMRGPVSNLNGGGKSGSGGDLRSASSTLAGSKSSTDSDKLATERNRYSVWSYPDMEFVCDLGIDIDDGAFRGWNNLTPVPEGDATRYVMLGFDRQATTDEDNWTYGNNYFLYSRQLNPGLEFAQKDADGKVIRPAGAAGSASGKGRSGASVMGSRSAITSANSSASGKGRSGTMCRWRWQQGHQGRRHIVPLRRPGPPAPPPRQPPLLLPGHPPGLHRPRIRHHRLQRKRLSDAASDRC